MPCGLLREAKMLRSKADMHLVDSNADTAAPF